jgi:hypothetical protein
MPPVVHRASALGSEIWRAGPLAWVLFLVVPVLLTVEFTLRVHQQPAFDFRALWEAGRSVWEGRNPYPTVAQISSSPAVAHQEFPYPAPLAVLMVPLGILPFGVAAAVFVSLLIASVVLTLRVLGVDDWRCYGIAFASIPVLESFRLGGMTPLLGLGLAGVWVMRDRRWPLAAIVTALFLAKLFLWPLYVWLLATRRQAAAFRAAILTCLVGVLGWWVVGFGSLMSYPGVVERMTAVQYRHSYSSDALFTSLGAGPGWARFGVIATAALGAAVILLVTARTRRDDLPLAIAVIVALLTSPLVWLHYYCLVLVPVALFSKRLSPVWLVPLLFWATPSPTSAGTSWRIALAFGLASAAVVLRGDRAQAGGRPRELSLG